MAVGKLDLEGEGGLTWSHSVLEHGLNLHRNIPLSGERLKWFSFAPYSYKNKQLHLKNV